MPAHEGSVHFDDESEGAPPADPAADDTPPPGLGDDPAALRSELEKVRKEAARYRTKARELEPFAQRAKELEDASKSEAEKLTERLTAAEQRALEAEQRAWRAEVAADKGLTAAQARRLVGTTKEELEADADELLESFRTPTGPTGTVPRERLTPGAVPDAEPDPDIDAVVAKVRRY